jgi:uncharacterized protein
LEARSAVNIVESRGVKFNRPYVLVGVPDIGLVGLISSSYIVEHSKMKEVGYVETESLPQVVVVHGSTPFPPVRLYGSDDGRLVVFISEIPLPPRASFEIASEIESWGKGKGAAAVIGVTGLPSNERLESDTDAKPKVYAISTSENIMKEIGGFGVKPFEEGLITGMYATLINKGRLISVPNLLLLAESYPEFPDPSAAASSVEVLNSMLGLKLDLKPLVEESEEIRLRMRDMMRRTQMTTPQASAPPSVYA